MENIDNTQNEEDNQNSSNKRSRRTPSKFGNYFEFEEVVEEEEKEEADEDDSDEDPSWVCYASPQLLLNCLRMTKKVERTAFQRDMYHLRKTMMTTIKISQMQTKMTIIQKEKSIEY